MLASRLQSSESPHHLFLQWEERRWSELSGRPCSCRLPQQSSKGNWSPKVRLRAMQTGLEGCQWLLVRRAGWEFFLCLVFPFVIQQAKPPKQQGAGDAEEEEEE